MHPGHVELFEYASKLGELIVGINTDEYLIKKHNKIVINLSDRIYMLQSIKYIKQVIPFTENTASELIRRINPDIFIKGPDYRGIIIPEMSVCEDLNIEYIIPPQLKKFNSRDFL